MSKKKLSDSMNTKDPISGRGIKVSLGLFTAVKKMKEEMIVRGLFKIKETTSN